MKQIIIQSCLGCNYLIDHDDPPAYCEYLDKDIDIPDEARKKISPDFFHEDCDLDDYESPGDIRHENAQFEIWLTKHFPHIKKEWDIYQETK